MMVTGDQELFEVLGGELTLTSDGRTRRCIGRLTCPQHESEWLIAALNACRSLTTAELEDAYHRVGWLRGKLRIRRMTGREENNNLRRTVETMGDELERLKETLRIAQLAVRERDAQLRDCWVAHHTERARYRGLEQMLHEFEEFVGESLWAVTHRQFLEKR